MTPRYQCMSNRVMPETFAEIPGIVRERVGAGERVLLVLIDAFGLEFLHRHRQHPLIKRLEITPLRSQFPSTTTAHITTMAFGQPVEQHGLYEWNILEPSLGRVICPLRYTAAESPVDGELLDQLPFQTLRPGATFFQTLGVPATVLLPAPLAGTTYTRMASAGASIQSFTTLGDGARLALAALASGAANYAYLYWDRIDLAGHMHGPLSTEFRAASLTALDTLWDVLSDHSTDELTVLFTADHGQVGVSPEVVDYADLLWPQLTDHLAVERPAGSSRDMFLHVQADSVRLVIDELSARFGERARVVRARELFTEIGPRLEARLGDVAVLPAAGRQTWLDRTPGNERRFHGQHGGLSEAERATYLAQLLH